MNDLTNDLLRHVAEYLPKTSRALWAVAITAPPSSWRRMGPSARPSEAGGAIVASATPGAPFRAVIDELMGEYHAEEAERHRGIKKLILGGMSPEVHEALFEKGLCAQLSRYYESQWEVLDFADLEISLASRLDDDDLFAILTCVDSRHNLKRLVLTNCFNIIGHGLRALQSSIVLEELSVAIVRNFEPTSIFRYSTLSLVGISSWGPAHHAASGRSTRSNPGENVHEEELLSSFRNAKLSEDVVLDLIGSITSREGNSFRRLQFPYNWIGACESSRYHLSREMEQFLGSHDNVMLNFYSTCLYMGFANAEEFCASFEDNDSIETPKDRCNSCCEVNYDICHHCGGLVCIGRFCVEAPTCSVCSLRYCDSCNMELGHYISGCQLLDSCSDTCRDCHIESCRSGENGCLGCKARAFDILSENYEQQQEEMTRLRQEVENLQTGN
ncbi:hypothetical protein ACHAWF_004606 [Thalassiosira exigua]